MKLCQDNKINHRTIKFKHPWTNGHDPKSKILCARAINKKIKQKVLTKYIFSDIIDLDNKLREFINDYNMTAKLKTLGYLSPKD